MARKATATATPVAPAIRAIDLIASMGFVVAVDRDLSLRDGERPTRERLSHAGDTMAIRYQDKVLEALKSVFGDRVSYLEAGETYTGDPRTGIAKKVHVEAPIPGSTPAPATTTAPIVATEVLVEYDELTVTELRGLAKDRGLKTIGTKAQLVKRLEKDDAENGEEE